MIDWERASGWVFNTGPMHIFLEDRPTILKLKANQAGDGFDIVRGSGGSVLPDAWLDTRFIFRGRTPLVWHEHVLDAWNESLDFKYFTAIHAALQDASADTLRLEGQIEVDDEKKNMVIIIPVEKAAKNAANPQQHDPLLIILKRASLMPHAIPSSLSAQKGAHFVSAQGEPLRVLQDGTAHGQRNLP